MKAIVTGGAGFIGSNLVDFLIDKEFEVIVIDNESSSSGEFHWNSNARNFKLDIRNYQETKELYKNANIVYHLAAETRIQSAIANPIETLNNNTLGTCVVLQCAREMNVGRFVFSSTSAIYGNNVVPNHESQVADCLNPYSISKLHGELLCQLYSKEYALNTIVLRYFNVYGNRQPTKGSHTPVLGLFLTQKNLNNPLTIVGDGNRRRDYVNVFDVVQANFLAGTKEVSKQHFGEVFNVGFGENYSVNEVARFISPNTQYIEDRAGEANSTLASIKKIKEVFGWTPKIALDEWLSSL